MDKTRLYCNICKNKTWHEVSVDYEQTYHDNFWGFDRLLQGQILKCCGCDYLSFRLLRHPFEFEDDRAIEEYIYPERTYKNRTRVFVWQLPNRIGKLYDQTVRAYDSELYLLSAVGLRALLEAVIVDKLQPQEYSTTIKSKVDALGKHFSTEVVNVLHEFRFIGNQAAHSLQEPEKLDLHRALNVVEDILTFFYGVEDSVKWYKELKEGSDSA